MTTPFGPPFEAIDPPDDLVLAEPKPEWALDGNRHDAGGQLALAEAGQRLPRGGVARLFVLT